MNKQKSQSGFAHLMILVIILAMGLIGSLGYIYWQNFIKKDNVALKQESSDDKKQADDNKVVDETSGWTKLDTEYFTMPVPDGWKLQNLTINQEAEPSYGDPDAVISEWNVPASDTLTYSKGQKATIKDVKIWGHGYDVNLWISWRQNKQDGIPSMEELGYTKMTSLKSSKGLDINKYYKQADSDISGVDNFSPAGTKYYEYDFNISIGKVIIRYKLYPSGQTDNVAQLEQALKAVVVK